MNNNGKLIIAIVLVVIMIPVMGTVYVKDNRYNNSYCATCHQDYYRNWSDPDVEYSLSNHHYQMGVSCQTCHQRTLDESLIEVVNYMTGNYYSPLPKSEVPMGKCFSCHGSYAELIPPLATDITGKARNPHDGHWGELECNECHNAHRDSVVYCDECHQQYMEEDTPGWVIADEEVNN